MPPLLEKGAIVLFQGDSITDGDRRRDKANDMGIGYAMIASGQFSALYPELSVRFLNRGISGNRVKDLRDRWQNDCIDLCPTWVSIMVGINDTWRRYDSNDPSPVQDFEAAYRTILERTVAELGAKLILCEPFVLPVSPDRRKWREDLDPKIEVIRQLAREFQAVLVPLDDIFAQAATNNDPTFWAFNGVHPSPAGNALIAQAWLRAVQAVDDL